ncbi:hypothetical protein M5362_15140 [Streptomyces sp. Je 1-79]|uniref:hypothetical protein n=1 Tax=Streptomyces sp. Je 1-79 TaxID=2943847 RepID=UPI0021A6995C|nr:hypothetical protein [Streptomyces sp. Je 1-79]MCT4354466.1 hypothetical protein [Streptomyces sp. Je 1-79]
MSEHNEWATGVDRDNGRPPHLPDLVSVDLRTLRVMDDPELAAAVERVLLRPPELVEAWCEGQGDQAA